MLPNEFDYLHNLVKPLIQKSNKNRLFPSCEELRARTGNPPLDYLY